MIDKLRRVICRYTDGKPEFFCLLFLLGLDFLLMAFGTYGLYFIDNFTIFPCMLFLGIAMTRKLTPSARRLVFLGVIVSFWFVFTQVMHFATDLESRPLGVFLSVVLLALPFAAVAEDGKKQLGLKLAGAAYLAAALVLVGLTAALYLDVLPGFLRPHVHWYGSRLYAMAHPNIVASILMIGTGFSLAFLGLCKKLWQKGIWLLVFLLLLATMSLTNSRTTIYLSLAMSACFAFFYVLQTFSWKRLAAAVLAMVITGAGLLMYTEIVQDTHTAYIVSLHLQQAAAQEESVSEQPLSVVTEEAPLQDLPAAIEEITEQNPPAATEEIAEQNPPAATEEIAEQNPPAVIEETSEQNVPAATQSSVTDEKIQAIEQQLIFSGGQSNLKNDLRTFNGRTKIWRSVIQALKDVPIRMIWGTDYSEPLLITYPPFRYEHCHNAWLETLLCMGIPGLVFALILTFFAAWQILVVLFVPGSNMWQKSIALLMLFLLGASMLEPYLFLADRYYHYTNMIFCLCLGYTTQWHKTKS